MVGIWYNFTLLVSYMVFNPFNIGSQVLLDCIKLAILTAKMIFSQIQQAPGPDSRKVGKSLIST